MALKSLSEALGLLAKKPLVWMPGFFAAFAILLTYYMYSLFGMGVAFPVGITLLVIMPAFLAGTYGIVIGDNATPAAFRKYAIYGYIRCLMPTIILLMIGWILATALTYLLMTFGLSVTVGYYFSTFVIIPLLFFCYFADITAVVNNLPAFRAIKDSAARVTNGAVNSMVFYIFNVVILLAASMFYSLICSLLTVDVASPLFEMNETQLIALSQSAEFETELLALVSTPEIISAAIISLAITACIFVPIFVVYKACFYKRLLVTNTMPEAANKEHQGGQGNQGNQGGSFDEKGRWYKYS